MTTVLGTLRRSLGNASFADITEVPLLVIERNCLEFAGDLTDDEVEQIRARMESVDDVDQAARANLRELTAAVIADPTPTNIAALAVAGANYQLGET